MASRSNFPTSVDSFIEHLELAASDKPLIQRYQELKLKTSRTPSEDDELATLTSQLRDKLITSEDFNKLQDAIVATQQHFRDNVDGYIQTKQTEFQAELDKFTHKGEYNPTIQYRKRNTVTFNGESYLCLQDVLGTAPDSTQNTVYWAKIAQRGAKGEQGVAGTGLRFKGAYNASTQYFKDDAVQFGGQVFACLQDNIGQDPNPNADTTYWSLAVSKGQSTKVTTLRNSVNVLNTTNNVPIGIPEFNSVTDELIVIKNTATLAKGINYQINANGSSIDSLEGLWDGTQYPITFHFIVLKNFVVDIQYQDGTLIQSGTVNLHSLAENAKPYISNTPPLNPIQNQIWIDTSQ